MEGFKSYNHESYGVIEIGRCQSSGNVSLFGSSILHHNHIRVSVKTATFDRGLNRDWIHSGKLIVDFIMSPTQFADAITSLNVGDGTPITLQYVTGDSKPCRESSPYESKTHTFNKEFDEQCKELSKRFDDTLKLAEETHAQKRLINEIQMLKQEIRSNFPFINKSFTEQMEHTVKEAKGEVEAFVTHAVQSYGLDAIRKQAPQIPESNTKLMIEQPKTEA
jgi:hypothetical protein